MSSTTLSTGTVHNAAVPQIVPVAIPVPLSRTFDYLPPADCNLATLQPGMRVRVPFGRNNQIGLIVGPPAPCRSDPAKLKVITAVLDTVPLFTAEDLALLHWLSEYYHHPLGEVCASALPTWLRHGRSTSPATFFHYTITPAGEAALRVRWHAPRQRALLEWLAQCPDGATEAQLDAQFTKWRAFADALWHKQYVTRRAIPKFAPPTPPCHDAPRRAPWPLNDAQRGAVEIIQRSLGRFQVFLLQGVTGSGKTEVYLHVIDQVLAQRCQVLVLLPEIALTPQLEARFRAHLPDTPLVVSHSGLSDGVRCEAWLAMQQGHAALLLGTRSALFTPIPRLGLIIVDEEHDPSYKQQDGLRFSARDAAILRARLCDVPIILGSATPSLESLHNATQARYRRLTLPQRAGGASAPQWRVLDIRNQPLQEGLSAPLLSEIAATLAAGQQVLLFLNRRGFAPVLICHRCGWVARCPDCDARAVVHRQADRLRCHHCGHSQALLQHCPVCPGHPLIPLGLGTERLETALRARFPGQTILRLDRDTTTSASVLQEKLDAIVTNRAQLILGTQMLAKGHHFPDVTLVAMIDVDSSLFSLDFRAPERLVQTLAQVAGRAGRAAQPGRALLQTRHPDHPLLCCLVQHGYEACAEYLLQERAQAGLPPFSHQALVRAESTEPEIAQRLLQTVAARLTASANEALLVLGPIPAPLPRKAGWHRQQLLLQCARRAPLHRALQRLESDWPQWKTNRHVRCSIDVDPLDFS